MAEATAENKAITTTTKAPAGLIKARDRALQGQPVMTLKSELDQESYKELIEQNFGGTMDEDLVLRVKFPAGGSDFFALPGADGKDEPLKQIAGAICFVHDTRAYWANPNPQGKPPDCSSVDGVKGTKYGSCADCKFSQFGTALRQDGTMGQGQACKELKRVYVLCDNDDFPLLLAVPPGSRKNWINFIKTVTRNKIGLHMVMTQIALEKDKTDDGIVYSVATFKIIGVLDEATYGRVSTMADQMKRAFQKVRVDARDYDQAGNSQADGQAARQTLPAGGDPPPKDEGRQVATSQPHPQELPRWAMAFTPETKLNERVGVVAAAPDLEYIPYGDGKVVVTAVVTSLKIGDKEGPILLCHKQAEDWNEKVDVGDTVSVVGAGMKYPDENGKVYMRVTGFSVKKKAVTQAKAGSVDDLPF